MVIISLALLYLDNLMLQNTSWLMSVVIGGQIQWKRSFWFYDYDDDQAGRAPNPLCEKLLFPSTD